MDRPLYAGCPRCGMRARIEKTYWDWDQDEDIAVVKCKNCGRSRYPYRESRIVHLDYWNPGAGPENSHYDLLIPPGWTEDHVYRLTRLLGTG